MKTSIRVNGDIQITLQPENHIEQSVLQEMEERAAKGTVLILQRETQPGDNRDWSVGSTRTYSLVMK